MYVTQLNHVAIHVKDLGTSINFYKDVLNLNQLPRPDFNFGGAWFSLGIGQELHLIEGLNLSIDAHRERHFALRVDSIEKASAHLNKKNIKFSGPKKRPDGAWQIFLNDPDSYFIELTQLV